MAVPMLAMLASSAAALPADPLASPFFAEAVMLALGEGADVAFDPRVRVIMPAIAENQREFPVTVDARAIPGVVRVVVFADLNPIQKAIDLKPLAADPLVSVRIKLDQRTPVRGAVQLADGRWLLGGGWIDAAGGGCSQPPVSRVKGDWAQHLGEARGGLWADGRVMLAFRHPMDTGFVDNIPAYHIETLTLTGSDGRVLAEMAINASVGEDPVFTLHPHLRPGEAVRFAARDTGGVESRGTIGGTGSAAGQ